jgi:hypothetical protein
VIFKAITSGVEPAPGTITPNPTVRNGLFGTVRGTVRGTVSPPHIGILLARCFDFKFPRVIRMLAILFIQIVHTDTFK